MGFYAKSLEGFGKKLTMINVLAEHNSFAIAERLANHREYQRVAVFVRVQLGLHGGEFLHIVQLVFEVGGYLKVFRRIMFQQVLGLRSVVYLEYAVVNVVEGYGSGQRVLVLGGERSDPFPAGVRLQVPVRFVEYYQSVLLGVCDFVPRVDVEYGNHVRVRYIGLLLGSSDVGNFES